MTNEELTAITDQLTDVLTCCTKEVLTLEEAARYMGVNKSHIYRLTAMGLIPHSKPTGKLCFFKRTELDEWLMSNRIATTTEINDKAQAYCRKKGGAR